MATTDRAPLPARQPLLFAAIGFVVFMFLELVIYDKGIGRALWISAVAAIVFFAVGFFFARLRAKEQAARG
jgi:uncharacterized membrane protein